jgi:predicted lipoprotein with Yx(FWY)xxD motif
MKMKIILVVISTILITLAVFHTRGTARTIDTVNSISKPVTGVTPVNNSVTTTKSTPQLGEYLTTPQDLALYVYDQDSPNSSNCTVSCQKTWPAYLDTGSLTNVPVNFSTFKRTDTGELQFTYKGHPLYTFIHDMPGKAGGVGVSPLFKLATP